MTFNKSMSLNADRDDTLWPSSVELMKSVHVCVCWGWDETKDSVWEMNLAKLDSNNVRSEQKRSRWVGKEMSELRLNIHFMFESAQRMDHPDGVQMVESHASRWLHCQDCMQRAGWLAVICTATSSSTSNDGFNASIQIFGSRPSDHYFRSVCWFVCLFVCAEFFSAVFDRISIKLGHMLHVWV